MMRARSGLANRRGILLVTALIIVGIASIIIAAFFTMLHSESLAVARSTGRVQALYLAEAGLDAANDQLSQDWASYEDEDAFPMPGTLTVSIDDETTETVGTFQVTVTEIDDATLQLISTGRSVPLPGSDPVTYQIQRTLTMVVARKQIPSFERRGRPGTLDLQASYFDKDGAPDLLMTTGGFIPSHGLGQSEGILTSASEDALAAGYHLLASFTDVDGDGDLDLVLSDEPSRGERRRTPHIPTNALSAEDDAARPLTATAADIMEAGQAMAFVSQGWIWLPNGSFSGAEPDTDIFVNIPQDDGTMIVSWGEIQP